MALPIMYKYSINVEWMMRFQRDIELQFSHFWPSEVVGGYQVIISSTCWTFLFLKFFLFIYLFFNLKSSHIRNFVCCLSCLTYLHRAETTFANTGSICIWFGNKRLLPIEWDISAQFANLFMCIYKVVTKIQVDVVSLSFMPLIHEYCTNKCSPKTLITFAGHSVELAAVEINLFSLCIRRTQLDWSAMKTSEVCFGDRARQWIVNDCLDMTAFTWVRLLLCLRNYCSS